MDLKPILKIAQKFASDNTAGILTGIGAAGTVVTAIMTGKATFRAAAMLELERDAREKDPAVAADDVEMTMGEAVRLVAREYIPPTIVGVMSVTAIIAANRVGARRQAAVVAAFKISEELGKEFRQKVIDTYGPEKTEKMNAELAKERIERIPTQQIIIVGGGDFLFFDAFSGRAFQSNMEAIKRAVNNINYHVNNYGWCSLSDFYEELGIGKTTVSDEFGWQQDELLDPMFTYVGLNDGRPACQLEFNMAHVRSFSRSH